jgi:hypothetical protein
LSKTQSTPEIYHTPEINEAPIPLRYSAIKFLIDKLYQLNAVEKQGIFRESGHKTKVEQIVRGLAKSPYVISNANLGEANQEGGVNEYAVALKNYLRYAPEPIVPYSDVQKLLDTLNMGDSLLRVFAISQILSHIRVENQLMLRALVFFLKQVVDNSDKNMMNVKNLGIALGPSVIRTLNTDTEIDFKTTGLCCEVLTLLVLNSEDIFADIQLTEPEASPPLPVAIPIKETITTHSHSLELNRKSDVDLRDRIPSNAFITSSLKPAVAINNQLFDDDDDNENDDLVDPFEFLGLTSSALLATDTRKKSSTIGPDGKGSRIFSPPSSDNLQKKNSDVSLYS